MSRQSQTMVSQAHAVQPAKPGRSAPAHRSASNPKMGNQAAQRLLRDGVIQTKLTVNQPGDRFEQEADRVAEQVMRLPDPTVGTPPRIQRMCSECEEELHRKEASSAQPSPTGIQLPRGAGLPLPESVRSFFEPRYGQDFGHVRIHTGSHADESAQSLNALAYTAGSDIVFAKGHYSPDTAHGRKLLAHELTHVIQQGNRRSGDTIQRACKGGVPSTPGCVPDPSITPPSTRFLFNVNCDDFAPGLPPILSEEARMDAFARAIPPTATVRIVGLASFDGPAELNERLSCSRAQRGLAVIRRSAPAGVTISSVDATIGGPSTATDPNMRAVGVNVSTPVPPRPEPEPSRPRPNPTVRVWVNSFIPHEVIEGPPGSDCFAGDKRGFSNNPSASSRTHQLIEVTPGTPHPTVSVRRIGTTHEVDCDTGRVIDSDTESRAALTNSAIIGRRTSAQADVFFSADASNPLVTLAPAINLDAEFHLNLATRQCRFEIDHDGFPAYEAYISADGAGGTTVYNYDPRTAGEGPSALFPPMDKSALRTLSF